MAFSEAEINRLRQLITHLSQATASAHATQRSLYGAPQPALELIVPPQVGDGSETRQ